MKLSILIPVHNEELNIGRCLDSIFQQNCQDIEIVVVDDASSDKSLDVVKSYQDKYANLKVISSTENIGCGPARNLAYRNSIGQYIWTIDADDWVFEGAIQKILAKIETNVDCIYLNFLASINPPKIRKPTTRLDLANTPVGPWCRVYKREFYVDFHNYRPEDVVAMYQLVDQIETVDYIEDLCYRYNTANPCSETQTYFYCSGHITSLEEYADSNRLVKAGLDDDWIPGLLMNLAYMYKIRNKLKHEDVKTAWRWKFGQEWNNFKNGKFCH